MNQTKFRATFTDSCCKSGAGHLIRELLDDIHEMSRDADDIHEKEVYLKVAYLLSAKSIEIDKR